MSDDSDQEDKTEEPTQRRIEKAIEQGNVANSIEVNTFFILSAFMMALLLASGTIAKDLLVSLRAFLMNAHQVPSDPTAYTEMGMQMLLICGQALLIPVSLVVIAGLAGGLVQHPLVFSTDALMPKFDRISPMARRQAHLRRGGYGPVHQGLGQVDAGGGRGQHHPVERARPARGLRPARPRGDAACHPGHRPQASRRHARHVRGHRHGRRLSISVSAGARSCA